MKTNQLRAKTIPTTTFRFRANKAVMDKLDKIVDELSFQSRSEAVRYAILHLSDGIK